LRNDRFISPEALRPGLKEMNSMFTSANGLNGRQIGELWDSIALTSLEKDVLASLQIIAPGAEGVSFVTDLRSRREIARLSTAERLPIVKIAGIADPLPLRSLGDGMQRMLGIALALVNARDGLLLIDEIENGIHYSAQSDLWRFIFEVASRLNVQVFATTHSWDCIEAFQKVARQNKAEGLLVRLSSKHNDIAVTLFDEEELGIATRERIEVR
ncbi:MAG: ATP-binding protein, partial [Chloroflexota bacterium]|nr:ATP-binding protein [Chloroflexota bacterium]